MKVVLFVEVSPLTDKFEQVMFTNKQAKAMRDAVAKILSPSIDLNKDDQTFTFYTNDEVKVVLPDIRDYYDDKDFEKED